MKFVFGIAVIIAVTSAVPVPPKVACRKCLKILNDDIKSAAKKSFDAVAQAGEGLMRMRDEFTRQQANLKGNLKKANEMILAIHREVDDKIDAIKKIANDASHKMEQKLDEIKTASSALGALEDKVNVKKTQDKANEVRHHIAKNPEMETEKDREILNDNGLITKVNAARILAESRAENVEQDAQKKEKILDGDIETLKKSMSDEEKDLNKEEDQEMKDESEAKKKIHEAIQHNKMALGKAKKFLKDIQQGISRFNQDIVEVRKQ